MTTPGVLPHTLQLCCHCRANPAGFWVRRTGGRTVRRPWCLTCCSGLNQGRFDVMAFDAAPRTRAHGHSQPGPRAPIFSWRRARPVRRPPS
jgi:hypothetical protein